MTVNTITVNLPVKIEHQGDAFVATCPLIEGLVVRSVLSMELSRKISDALAALANAKDLGS